MLRFFDQTRNLRLALRLLSVTLIGGRIARRFRELGVERTGLLLPARYLALELLAFSNEWTASGKLLLARRRLY